MAHYRPRDLLLLSDVKQVPHYRSG